MFKKKKLNYLTVLFKSEGKIEHLVKRDLSLKVNLAIYQSIYVPTHGHELLVRTEGMRSWIQVAKTSLFELLHV